MQINPLIMALVLADFVRPATRVPRGVLIGIAGGLKLTPLVFGLILLVRRDWKGIATLGATFLTTIAVGFILLPNEAPQFWFSAISDPSRVGDINFVDNISIQGWLMHFGLKGTASSSASTPWPRSALPWLPCCSTSLNAAAKPLHRWL